MLTPMTAAGRNHYGAELTVAPGTTDPEDVTTTFAWLRDGVAIEGATEPTYRPLESDVGRAITAQITIAKPRYRSIVRTFDFARTTTPSAVDVRTTGRKRRAAVRVKVTAPGATPSGPVLVKVGRTKQEGVLSNGFVRVVLRELKPGERTVKVVFVGDGVAQRSRGVAEVLVKKGKKK